MPKLGTIMDMKQAMDAGIDVADIFIKVEKWIGFQEEVKKLESQLELLDTQTEDIEGVIKTLLDEVPEDEYGVKYLAMGNVGISIQPTGEVRIKAL